MSTATISDPLAPHPLLGALLGGTYEVKTLLDRGGMGMVFEAEHVRLRRRVVVKVLPAHLAREPIALHRFQREAELVSSLQHPHVVQILDFATTEHGEPYLVMEFLRGETLASRLIRKPALPIELAVRIAAQAAAGLAAVHDALIVHRDLTPSNIFLSELPNEEVHVKLLDFGIGKRLGSGNNITGENDVIGTPDYMPPEQALGKASHVDQRSDQYSLGVIVYQMLAGRRPFLGDMASVLMQVVSEEPPPIEQLSRELPPGIGPVLRRAMAKEPSDRFPSIVEFAVALGLAAGAGQGSIPPPGLTPKPPSVVASRAAPSEIPAAPEPPMAGSRLTPGPEGALAGPPSLSALLVALERARAARSARDLDGCAAHVERALTIADILDNDACRAAVAGEEALIEGALEMRLGRRDRPLSIVAPTPGDRLPLSPEEAFLLSRIDGVVSSEELLDLSPLPRLHTLRLLVRMLRSQLITT